MCGEARHDECCSDIHDLERHIENLKAEVHDGAMIYRRKRDPATGKLEEQGPTG